MKQLPIPEIEQINSILNGSFYELVSLYVENPSPYFLKEYITIDRKKMIKFLKKSPNRANDIFEKHKKSSAPVTHDIYKILQKRNYFIVVWMDHGKPDTINRFKTIEEAVTEYIFIRYGIFRKNSLFFSVRLYIKMKFAKIFYKHYLDIPKTTKYFYRKS